MEEEKKETISDVDKQFCKIKETDSKAGIYNIAVSRNGQYVIGFSQHTVLIFDKYLNEINRLLKDRNMRTYAIGTNCIAYSMLYYGGIRVINILDESVYDISTGRRTPNAICFSKCGKYIAAGADGGYMFLWKLEEHKVTLVFEVRYDYDVDLFESIEFDMDSRVVVYLSDVFVYTISIDDYRLLYKRESNERFTHVRFGKENKRIFLPTGATVNEYPNFNMKEVSNVYCVNVTETDSYSLINAFDCYKDGNYIMVAPSGYSETNVSGEAYIRMWDTNDQTKTRELVEIGKVHTFALNPTMDVIYVVTPDGKIAMWAT